jgi:hypothetical protein
LAIQIDLSSSGPRKSSEETSLSPDVAAGIVASGDARQRRSDRRADRERLCAASHAR